MPQRNYSFKSIICMVGGVQAFGFGDGDDAILIDPIEDVASMMQGCDGWATISKNAATGVKITLKLLDTSPFNGILQATLTSMDALGQIIPIPIFLKDLNGLDLLQVDQAVISKRPSAPYGKNANIRQWEFLGIPNAYTTAGHPFF